MRRPVILLLFAVLAAGCGPGRASDEDRRIDFSAHNLLLVTIDTLRADRLGSYGYEAGATPRLDALAAGGVRFASCYASVPLTLPSHATIFTGKYPFRIGVRVNGLHYLPAAEPTLAELLRERGFVTFAAVAAYVVAARFGLSQGFDEYDDRLPDGRFFQFTSEIPAAEVGDKFRRWLDQERRGRFFAWLHFYDPHLPFAPPGEFRQRFPDAPYDGEIAYVDGVVGRVLDDLRAHGLDRNTLVVVTSDHGEAFGEHGEEGHGLLAYEETLRVPLIFWAPGRLPAGAVVPSRVRLADLMPTVLELFDVAVPPELDGRSLAPLLRGAAEAPRTTYFESLAGYVGKHWTPLVGILAGPHKYFALPEPELYDLERDPGERHNLIAGEPQVAGELDAALRRLLPPGGAAGGAARRELSAEERRHLEALGYLTAAPAAAGPRVDTKRGIGYEMAQRAVRTAVLEGRLETAEQYLAATLDAYPGVETADEYDLRYLIAAAQGRPEVAIAALEEGIARFPQLGALRLKLAGYLLERGQYAAAERHCRELLAQNPRASEAMTLLGMVAEARGEKARAVEWYEQAATLEPGSVATQLRLADALARGGDRARALGIYEALLASGSLDDQAESLFKAAMLFAAGGRPERAEELFRRGLELAPAGVHHLSLALVLARRGKTREAIRHLEIALGEYRGELTPEQIALATGAIEKWRASSP